MNYKLIKALTIIVESNNTENVITSAHGLIDHPLKDRIKQIKKPKSQAGPTTVLAYDLKEGVWSKLFHRFSEIANAYGIELKPPLDKTPHVTLAYIINATEIEIETAKNIAKSITPFNVIGVSYLRGVDKTIYVVLDLQVTSAYRNIYNEIESLVGQHRLRDFRTIWKGHIPHASIAIIPTEYGNNKKELKEILKKVSGVVKSEHLAFMPNFVEVHKDTKLTGFSPEMIDYTSLVDA